MEKSVTNLSTRISRISAPNTAPAAGNRWKEKLIEFFIQRARRPNEGSLLTLSYEEGGGVTLFFPIDVTGSCWARGTVVSATLPEVPPSSIRHSNAEVSEIRSGWNDFVYGPWRMFVIDFDSQLEWQKNQGHPTAILRLYFWKSARTGLEMAGKEVAFR